MHDGIGNGYGKSKFQSPTLQVAVHSPSLQQNEEKKIEEVTFENMWKKNMKVRRQFMYYNTIVVTYIKSKELKSATAYLQIHFLEILGHYLFILQSMLITSMTLKICKLNKKIKATITKELYVLLRGVSIHESENEIKEILEDYGYQIQEVKRFHKMLIVKVMLSNSSYVVKILKDNDIQW
ncbi:hypothetical protein RFI_34349 [Reticulomyxa filosa]|uniref:Uncharacterized protein n=1 Tax=Reticulomyxa filosa TaxID=46433 RepID=X6LNV5_RETFI|nr:hypothetical protein RFI_34349 [Reticulomyxa filosa]|eukprot:ETO03061.1 hypothetical protein RFI_34349 [Reticulomyxa filosa]